MYVRHTTVRGSTQSKISGAYFSDVCGCAPPSRMFAISHSSDTIIYPAAEGLCACSLENLLILYCPEIFLCTRDLWCKIRGGGSIGFARSLLLESQYLACRGSRMLFFFSDRVVIGGGPVAASSPYRIDIPSFLMSYHFSAVSIHTFPSPSCVCSFYMVFKSWKRDGSGSFAMFPVRLK